jgi:hypothetical protein
MSSFWQECVKCLDRAGSDEQPLRDLAIRPSLGGQAPNAQLGPWPGASQRFEVPAHDHKRPSGSLGLG